MGVGIVVPAYRPDVERLETYVGSLRAVLEPDEIIVELDAPHSETAGAIRALPIECHVAPTRRGKGAAVTAGFERLDTDVLAFADADGSTPAESLKTVIAAVEAGRTDIAAGSRRHPAAEVRSHQTYARRWLGDGFAWLARRLLAVDLYDYQCGAKAVSQAAWKRVRGHLYEPGFAWDVELIAMAGALGMTVEEVPVVWEDRRGSTVAPVGTTVELLRALMSVRHRAKLLADHPLHTAIDAPREPPVALVDQLKRERTDE